MTQPPLIGYLVLPHDAHPARRTPILTPPFTIGRDPRCKLHPADDALRPLHAVIHQREGTYYLQDKSGGATRVNGRRVKTTRLHAGDQIQIGSSTFTFTLAPAPLATPRVLKARPKPPPPPEPADPFAEMAMPPTQAAPAQPEPLTTSTFDSYSVLPTPDSELVSYFTPDPEPPSVPNPAEKRPREWMSRLYMAAFLIMGIMALGVILSSLMDRVPIERPDLSEPPPTQQPTHHYDRDDSASSRESSPRTSRGGTLLYFYADWCTYCRQQRPIVTRFEQQYAQARLNVDYYNVDAASSEDIVNRYRVSGLPTTILVDSSGREARRMIGLTSEGAMRQAIENMLYR
jgi:thiol-disulfide isomerase/thioredoxin